jgi:hypothetical protein
VAANQEVVLSYHTLAALVDRAKNVVSFNAVMMSVSFTPALVTACVASFATQSIVSVAWSLLDSRINQEAPTAACVPPALSALATTKSPTFTIAPEAQPILPATVIT